MSINNKAKHVLIELKGHAPYTCIGAFLGILFMLLFRNIDASGSKLLFSIFHPSHVILSAMVTSSMFRVHELKKNFLIIIVISYFGSVGIATLSDIIIPHFGAKVVGLEMPTHNQIHEKDLPEDLPEDNHKSAKMDSVKNGRNEGGIHLGFIEEWYIISPAAFLGILLAFFLPRTKLPHAGHVLISTWASSSYLLMMVTSEMTIAAAFAIFTTLFIAIWIPCCISDIVFPLLFIKPDIELNGPCAEHSRHSHEHMKKDK
jgi:hypothetical protein